MAAPNIVAVTTITGKTVAAALTTGGADIVTNPAGSGKVFKVNTVYVTNIDGTNNAAVTVGFYDASSATTFDVASTITVPADSMLDVFSKPVYLEEGDKLTGVASADGDLNILISYEEIS